MVVRVFVVLKRWFVRVIGVEAWRGFVSRGIGLVVLVRMGDFLGGNLCSMLYVLFALGGMCGFVF